MDIETIRTLTPLEPLPSRVYFVCRHLDRWADVLRGDDQVPESLDADPDRVVTHEDITEREQANEGLRRERERETKGAPYTRKRPFVARGTKSLGPGQQGLRGGGEQPRR